MFNKFPIQIGTRAMNVESMLEQLDEIKVIFKLGINWDAFYNVLLNAHNGMSGREKNSFDLNGWVNHYKTQHDPISIEVEQIEAIFNYITKFHTGIIQKNDKLYSLINSPDMSSFQLEFIVFKAIE